MAITDSIATFFGRLRAPDARAGSEQRLAQPASPPAPLRVIVEVPGLPPSIRDLGVGHHLFGSSPDCDLILPDIDTPRLASLRYAVGPRGAAVVLVPEGEGMLRDGQPLPAGQPVVLAGVTQFEVDGLLLTIEPPSGIVSTVRAPEGEREDAPRVDSSRAAAAEWMRRVGAGAQDLPVRSVLKDMRGPAIALLVALISALAAWWLQGHSGSATANAARSSTAEMAAAAQPRLSSANDVVSELKRHLASADLVERVTIVPGSNEIVLEGAVGTREEKRLVDVLAAVRARTDVTITSRVKPDPSAIGRSIAAVALAPYPFVVFRDGERYKVGDTLPSGWKIESIAAGKVVVTREGLREAFEF